MCLVVKFLIILFLTHIPNNPTTAIPMKSDNDRIQFPVIMESPVIVDVSIAGILASVDKMINVGRERVVSGASHVRRSFGVPGIKNKMKITNAVFFESFKNFHLLISSSPRNLRRRGIPNFLTRIKINVDVKTQPVRMIANPFHAP